MKNSRRRSQTSTRSSKQDRRAPLCARTYRRASPHADEASFQVVAEQTDLWITANKSLAATLPALALDIVNSLRAQVSSWILLMPEFAASLTPVPIPAHAPEIICRMGASSARMNVGPMATVAGAIAAMTAEALRCYSPEIIIENGGDTILYTYRERVVGILAHPAQGAMLGLRIAGSSDPVALCASSSTIGHSLSFGKGEVTVVRSQDACLADAAATAFGNLLKEPEDVAKVTDLAAAAPDIDGIFVQCGENIGVWGDMELVAGVLP